MDPRQVGGHRRVGPAVGDVVEGKIVRIDKDEMLVDVGAKSEGVVSNRELYGRNAESQPELNVGDQILVYVLQPESTDGHAVLSVRRAGLEPRVEPIRGGTDGSKLSFMGLPTPNIFAGEHNFHSRYEWISTHDMHKAVEVIIELSQVWAERSD